MTVSELIRRLRELQLEEPTREIEVTLVKPRTAHLMADVSCPIGAVLPHPNRRDAVVIYT